MGVPVSPGTALQGGDSCDDADPDWRKRPVYRHMKENVRDKKRRYLVEKAKKRVGKQVERTVGPYAETIPTADVDDDIQKIKYGELRFEENGRVVPYIIVPERRRDPEELLGALRKMKPAALNEGRELAKPPSILFDVASSGYDDEKSAAADASDEKSAAADASGCDSYLSWAQEVYVL